MDEPEKLDLRSHDIAVNPLGTFVQSVRES